ncbi:MAG: hypothetical protein AAFV85_01720 [Cyanobacteria bacterium J06634_6]
MLKTAPKTQLTIELSPDLVEQLNSYLSKNPEESLERLLRDALHVRQVPEDPDNFLELAGFVKNVHSDASKHPEDAID